MTVFRYPFEITLSSIGGATAVSAYPLNGYVLEVRADAAAFGGTSTATYVLTRLNNSGTATNANGGTILTVASQATPFQYSPREGVVTSGGAAWVPATGGTAPAPFPVDGLLQLAVTSAVGLSQGTVHVYLDSAKG